MSFKKFALSVALFFILLLAAFIRLATISKLMVFTPDEEYILFITQTLVHHLHIIWIGVSALGFDFYMGPALEYFLVPFMWLFKGDPIVWGIITCLFGVITTYLAYWFGQKIFSKKSGLLAALIYASSALLVFYDGQPYPTAVPLLSISLLISLYMTKHKKIYWVIFSALFGLVFHIHLSLVLIIFVAIYWALTHKNTWDIKTLVFSLFAFLVVISPLIGFDYFHKGSNITAPIRVFQALGKNKNAPSINTRLLSLGKATTRIFYLNIGKSNTDEILYPCNFIAGNNATKISLPVIFLIIILLITYFRKRDFWKNESKRLLLIYSLAFLIPFIFLSSVGSVEYYLLGFFPVFVLLISYTITTLKWPFRYFFYLLILIFVLYNFVIVFAANGDYGISVKKKVINQVMTIVGKNTYSLEESGGPCQGTAGWGYLFSVYGRSPDNNVVDKQFNWLVPVGNMAKTKYSILINESRFPSNQKSYKYKFTTGGFTTYIWQN